MSAMTQTNCGVTLPTNRPECQKNHHWRKKTVVTKVPEISEMAENYNSRISAKKALDDHKLATTGVSAPNRT